MLVGSCRVCFPKARAIGTIWNYESLCSTVGVSIVHVSNFVAGLAVDTSQACVHPSHTT